MVYGKRFAIYILILALFIVLVTIASANYVDLTYGLPPNQEPGSTRIEVIADGDKLFNVGNIFPGWKGTSDVKVNNVSDENFTLGVRASMIGGDDILYEKLEVEVLSKNGNTQYYNGPISSMGSLTIGEVIAGDNKDLKFIVGLPSDAGNVYQGTKASIRWFFNASGFAAPADPDTDPGDPTFLTDVLPTALTTPDFPDADSPDFSPDDTETPLDDAPVDLTPVETAVAVTDADDAPEATETDELAVAPEAPQVDPGAVEGVALTFNYWFLLLPLLIPALFWFIFSRLVLVQVPDSSGEYKTVARKLARRKEKRWFVNLEKELDKHLARHGLVVVDFRGSLLKKARKLVYAGEKLVGSGDLRYAMIGSQLVAAWSAELKKRAAKAAG